MSSILTNNSAMVALQTLKTINGDLGKTQQLISTGKHISSAKDNASVWAISKVMEADVKGFKGIANSLNLGESTVAVARQASETVTDLLTDIKGKVVAAQEGNVDRAKIQTDIDVLTDQIKSVVGAAQFNGLNMVKGTDDVNILASLDRSAGGVVASHITVARQDLTTSAGSYGGGGTSLSANASISDSATAISPTANYQDITLTFDASGTYDFTIGGNSISVAGDTDLATTTDAVVSAINALGLEGITASNESDVVRISSTRAFEAVDVTASASGGSAAVSAASATISQRAETITFSSGLVNDGDSYRVSLAGKNYDYIAGKGESFEDVVRGLKTAVDGGNVSGVTTKVEQDDSGNWTLQIDNDSAADLTGFAVTGENGGTASGGLFGLDNIDVTTDANAAAALGNIETLIGNSIDAAAAFGSAQGRIETQSDFVGKLTDALRSGIGALVDAEMEEASARLQALQVQQQLGVQSLSIANQAPQSILSLFR
jgi:flagellin